MLTILFFGARCRHGLTLSLKDRLTMSGLVRRSLEVVGDHLCFWVIHVSIRLARGIVIAIRAFINGAFESFHLEDAVMYQYKIIVREKMLGSERTCT
jgi:hypothetical protein